MSNPNRLIVLHATDVHHALERVTQLQRWLKEHQQRIDIVLLSGDIANKSMEFDSPPEEVARHHDNLEEVVAQLSTISKQLYYIPGNHDAITAFDPNTQSLSSPPCNVHMGRVKLTEQLHLMGFGGSLPGYQHGQFKWAGFPYTSEEEMAADLVKLVHPVFFSDSPPLNPDDRVLLMTHNGPKEISTTVDHLSPRDPIISGCGKLYELLCSDELQKHVLMNLHGHTHYAAGRATIGNTTVVNPGALMEGHFGVYTLVREVGGETGSTCWKIESTCFYALS